LVSCWHHCPAFFPCVRSFSNTSTAERRNAWSLLAALDWAALEAPSASDGHGFFFLFPALLPCLLHRFAAWTFPSIWFYRRIRPSSTEEMKAASSRAGLAGFNYRYSHGVARSIISSPQFWQGIQNCSQRLYTRNTRNTRILDWPFLVSPGLPVWGSIWFAFRAPPDFPSVWSTSFQQVDLGFVLRPARLGAPAWNGYRRSGTGGSG